MTAEKVALLSVENLKTGLPTERGYARAVDGVSFALGLGQAMGLVGESGCGKSMLARTIMGLLPQHAVVAPDSAIVFNGQNLTALSPKRLRHIAGREMAMIFQDPMTALNPVLTVGAQIAEVMRHHLAYDRPAAREKAIAMMHRVGIPMPEQRAGQYPHQLSGGLRQRVAIAIALACAPKLLIADEPTTALDATVRTAILDLLDGLRAEKNMAMLLITHDLGTVAGRTDVTAVMYAGSIVEYAPTARLFANVRMPYTRALIDAIPRLTDPPHTRLQTIDGQPPDLAESMGGCRFAPRCPRANGRCRTETPPLRTDGDPGHRFACWYPLYDHGN